MPQKEENIPYSLNLNIQKEKLNKMPIAEGTAALIGAGLAAASQGANAAVQGKMNLRTRQFAEEMYFRQRKDNLADWNQQNAYNSPAAQMQRLKQAGLNPHLVYGSGSVVANSQSMPNQANAQPWHPQAPQFDLGSVSRDYFSTIQRQAQTQQAATSSLQMEDNRKLIAAQTLKTISEVNFLNMTAEDRASLVASQRQYTDILAGKASAETANTVQTMGLNLEENARKWVALGQSAEQLAQNIINSNVENKKKQMEMANIPTQKKALEAQIGQLKSSTKINELEQQIKNYEISLNKQGIQKGDPLYVRKLAEFVGKLQSDTGSYQYNKKSNFHPIQDFKNQYKKDSIKNSKGSWFE